SFNGSGKVTTDFNGSTDQAEAVAIQADGKIVVVGAATVGGALDFALARYTSTGLDSTFGNSGKVTTDFAGSTDDAYDVAIQGDGKIIATGTAFVGAGFDFALARYN